MELETAKPEAKKLPKKKPKKGRVCCDNCHKEFPKKMAHKTESKTLCNVCVLKEN